MTQALNLANFANNLNTSGATTNAGLQNSSVTVTAGTGMSGGGAVSLGSSVTLTNAGVTSIVAGTGISISGATGAVTVTNSSPGAVTSVNGQTGAVVTTTQNNIGSILSVGYYSTTILYAGQTVAGSSLYYPTGYSALTGGTFFTSGNGSAVLYCYCDNFGNFFRNVAGNTGIQPPNGTVSTLSGTWRVISTYTPPAIALWDPCSGYTNARCTGILVCRVS